MLSRNVVLIILGIVVAILLNKMRQRAPIYTTDKILNGKTVLITGGSSGIGKAAATEFAKLGARVIIAAHNLKKSLTAKDEIIKESGNNNIASYELDLENYDSVQEFAKQINEKEKNIDILINNAGVAVLRGLTKQGINRVFAVNHLGHFLLTNLLLKTLTKRSTGKKTGARIINVSSSGYVFSGKFDFEFLKQADPADTHGQVVTYGYSKLANILFTLHLNLTLKEEHGITSYAICPGPVHDTGILRKGQGWFIYLWKFFTYLYKRSSYEGCQTIMYCALDDNVINHSGSFFEHNAVSELKEYAKDETAAKELWEISLNLTGLEK